MQKSQQAKEPPLRGLCVWALGQISSKITFNRAH